MHEYGIDQHMLDQYGIDPAKAAKLAEQFGINSDGIPADALNKGSPVMMEKDGLGDLHTLIHEATAAYNKKQEDRGKQIEQDFTDKLINYKTETMGAEYRLFGKTMVSFDQLTTNVKHDQCVQLGAHHKFHVESLEKWLCKPDLDAFWDGECVRMNSTF